MKSIATKIISNEEQIKTFKAEIKNFNKNINEIIKNIDEFNNLISNILSNSNVNNLFNI